jgi:hypothetical protein
MTNEQKSVVGSEVPKVSVIGAYSSLLARKTPHWLLTKLMSVVYKCYGSDTEARA